MKIKNVLIILSLLCITFAYSFAQIVTGSRTSVSGMSGFINNLDQSARKRATAGEFSSDSDKLKAKSVFDLDRTIFSAGYVPGLNSSGSQAVQAFFGVPILNNAMYFGFAGVYEMTETRVDYNNGTATRPNWTGATTTTSLYLGKHTRTGSTFALRPVFKINDMISLHYLIARGNIKTNTKGYTSLDLVNNGNYSAITNTSGTSQWVHEIAVGVVLGEMKLTIPVRLTVNEAGQNYSKNYSITKSVEDNGSSAETNIGSTNTGNKPINLAFMPEFYMPLVSGPMTGITVGLTLGFDVYGMGQKESSLNSTKNVTVAADGSSTNEVSSKTAITYKQEKMFNMNMDVNFYPTLSWSLANDRVQLVMEPKVGLKINVTNAGNVTRNYEYETTTTDAANPNGSYSLDSTTKSGDKTSIVETTPYVSFPLGTVFKPVDWFEFRAGIKYTLGFNMYSGSTTTLNELKFKSFNYRFTSAMDLFTGMGFIIGEDFFIDLFLAAQANTANKSIFAIDSWGAQLSYRL